MRRLNSRWSFGAMAWSGLLMTRRVPRRKSQMPKVVISESIKRGNWLTAQRAIASGSLNEPMSSMKSKARFRCCGGRLTVVTLLRDEHLGAAGLSATMRSKPLRNLAYSGDQTASGLFLGGCCRHR